MRNIFWNFIHPITNYAHFFFRRLVECNQLTPTSAKNVRLFISGSATLLASLFDEFYVKTGKRICERYGMTETLVSTSNPVDNDAERLPG